MTGDRRIQAALLLCASAFASVWAGVLVHAHQGAVRHTLQPGVLCGPEGGCGDVLASQWATFGGVVAVSTPAVPLFAAIAVLAGLVLAGRLDPRRVAVLATATGVGGLLLGGWLLYHMLVSVGHVCRYCLIMDAATAAVLAAGLMLHPDGPLASLRAIPEALARAVRPGPELAVAVAVLVGTVGLTLAVPEPAEGSSSVVIVDEAGEPLPGQAAPSGETQKLTIPPGQANITFTDTTPLLGPPDAPVTIVLFEDFQCPFCRKLTGSMEAFRKERPGKVRFAWFHFPMHSACNARPGMADMHADACGAAVAAECARRQGKFWEYHDRLFQDQRLAAADLLADAQELGLDLAAFTACQSDPSARDKVLADTTEGRKFNITGTPTWFVNGKRFSGTQSVEALRAIADAVVKAPDDGQTVDVAMDGEVFGPLADRPASVALKGPRGPFTIDTYEASVVDGVARSLPNVEPSRGLSWTEAYAACRAADQRLCTEDEWLTACTGAVPIDRDADGQFSDDPLTGRAHPYGAYPQPTWCASNRQRVDPRPLVTANHPRCVTPDGVADLEGGVKEWVGLAPHLAALQGGSYFSGDMARCAFHKINESPDSKDGANGFRCCNGPEPQLAAAEKAGGRVGDTIQEWSVDLLDGGTIGSQALAGKPYIVVFWASYCAPCRKELPVLAQLYERYRKAGLEIVAVTVDSSPPPARKYLGEQPLPFPIAIDPKSELMAKFDAPSTPTSFLVTRSGKIRQRNIGYDEKSGGVAIESHIRALLAAP